MAKYFNSKEAYSKQLEKNRLRNQIRRRKERAEVLKSISSEIKRVSSISSLANSLAAQVTIEPIKPDKELDSLTLDLAKRAALRQQLNKE